MTPTKTFNRNSAFGAVKRTPTDSDDLDWSTPQINTPEVDDGVNLLSSLLLSLILKLEDREHRVKDHTAGQRTLSADETSDRSDRKHFDDYDCAGALVTREDSTQWEYSSDSNTEDTQTVDDDHYDTITKSKRERSQAPNDPTRPNYNQITGIDSAVRSDVSEDMLPPSSDTFEDDVTLTSLCMQGQGSAYRDSAVHIVGDAMLRAIANIFTNGVIRRGIRTYGITVWNLTEYQSTQGTIPCGQPLIPISEGMRQIKPKSDLVSPEWLYDVNRRIAAPKVTTVSQPDSMPPSVASSCNVSRCSSVDILSCGDRALKVKAILPSQSKLLWRMVQKSHGSNNVKKPADEPDLIPGYVPVSDGSAKEKKVELSKALERVRESTPRKRFWGEKSTDVETIGDGTCLEVDRLVKFRDSAAQTEKKDFQKDDKSTRDDDVIDTKQKIKIAKSQPYSEQPDERVTTEVSTAQTNQEPTLQVKQLSVPPIASPLLMDVVWRHASGNDMTNQEERNFKAYFARGGIREREQAEGVVESAVHRAVSAVFVDRVISDSLESLTSLSELRVTPSFKKAAADLTKGPPLQFEWYPYLEGSAGPCKVTDRRRQRIDRTGEAKTQPRIMGTTESSDVYEDAREKFGSSDDLLTNDLKGRVSSDDEFTDAVCESDYAECQVNLKKPTAIDKATQVSHTAYGKDSSGSPSDDIEDEPKSPAVQLELPMESINYIKDQFKDVKVLVAKYRELLYEPLDESAPVESQAQPQTTADLKEVNTWQIEAGSDETDEDDDVVVARKPNQKHIQVEKEMKKAVGKSTKLEKQSEKLTKDEAQAEKADGKLKEKTGKGKTKTESFPAEREVVNKDVLNKDEGNAESTHKQPVAHRSPKVKEKRKKRDDSPTLKDKTSVRRKLKKTGEKMRTPTGRQRFGKTVLEKTTRDGFLPLNGKAAPEDSLESGKKTGTTELSRTQTEEKSTMSPTDEDKPKVKNHISFFEKFSKHSLKRSDQAKPSSNSPSPEPDTPKIHNVEKSERLSHSDSIKQKVAHQKDEMKRKGKDSSKTDELGNPESGVDSTPGKGIWTNRAFFEALGELDDQKVQTRSVPPKTAKRILEEGILDEPGNEEDGQPGPSFKTKREISRREKSPTTSPEKTGEKSKSTASRRTKKSRNKNTNNEAPMDQVTTDDSCVSSSQCSCTDTVVDANGKIAIERLPSSKITTCDDDIETVSMNTENSRDSRSDEVERTVQTTEIIPKLSSGSLTINDAETTENGRVSSSPCSDSKNENDEDAVLVNNITHQRLSFEKVTSDEATSTETRCVSSSPCSGTRNENKEEAFLSNNVTPRQQLSSESLHNGKAGIPKSPSNHIETENEECTLKSKDIIFDQKLSSESLSHIDGPSRGHSHFQMDHDQDKRDAVNMKETILQNSQSTESVTDNEPQKTEIKKNHVQTTDLDDDSVVLQPENHHTHIGQAISRELTEEESKVTSADDLLAELSLFDDLSREVQIHSPPPTGELDDVSSLNNLDVPLLTSSPHPHRHLKMSNTSSVESIEKGGVPDQTPPILRNNRDDDDDVNHEDEDSGDDLLHHLRNTSFLMACNPDCYMSKDQPILDVQINEDVDERKMQNDQEKRTSNRPMENPQPQPEIKQDEVNIFKVASQPKSELRSNVCQAMTSDGEQEAGSKVKSSTLETERTRGEQRSCLRFSLFRKSKKRSRSKNISLGQSEGKQQQSSNIDCVPQDETYTASKVEEEDAVAMVTKECTNEEVDVSTDSNPTPPGSQKRKFRLKYLRKSKKHKKSSKT